MGKHHAALALRMRVPYCSLLRPKQDLLSIAITQLCILNAAWAFYIVVSIKRSLALPDRTAGWVYRNPTETTVVVTVIATVVSAMTLSCFTRAAKHALRQHIGARGSISLADLSMGIAVASASFRFKHKRKYIGPTLGTVIIATGFGLVNSAWTTFLSPVQVNVLVSMNGEELDLGNHAFDAVLGQDMNNTFVFSNGTLVTQPDSSNSLTSFGFAGGLTSATAYASGQPGIVNFNNVTYSVSTGGILSGVYGSTQNATSTSTSPPGTPASFGGGPVPTNLKASSDLVGISRTYNITQQGLTANVSCFNYTDPADWYPIDVEAVSVNATFEMGGYVSGIIPIVNTTLPRMICNRNTTDDGMIASMAAINFNNSNYLASVVCPYTWLDALNSEKIVVYHSGVGKYASLPPTICEITLLMTQSSVTYANQLVTATPHNSTAIPYQRNLNYWVTLFIELEEWGFQTARVNSLGNMLLSLLTTGSTTFVEAPVQSYQLFLQEYWKGVIEVTGTALRSGYTAYPQNITASMRVPMVGTQNVTTMGWTFDRVRMYALFPITFTAVMTIAVILYALYHAHLSERGGRGVEAPDVEMETRNDNGNGNGPQPRNHWRDGHSGGHVVVPSTAIATFDASDPIHLIVAAVARVVPEPGSQPTAAHVGRRYWEQYEDIEVCFQLDRR